MLVVSIILVASIVLPIIFLNRSGKKKKNS